VLSGSIVGKWKTISEICENTGEYTNGYSEQTKLKKITYFNANGTFGGEQVSHGRKYKVEFKGTYQLIGDELTTTVLVKTNGGVNNSSLDAAQVQISNKFLIITHQITEEGRACPVGDTTITTMRRL
jgi:hypothetical protein